jgi:transposase-like protein
MVNVLKKMVAALQALSAADFRQVERCPHCRGTDWGQWGIGRAGLPRFRSKACGRTFNGFTGPPFAYVKKREKLQAHARCLIEEIRIRRTAALGLLAQPHSLGGIAAERGPNNAIRPSWAALLKWMKPIFSGASRDRERGYRVRPKSEVCRRPNGG